MFYLSLHGVTVIQEGGLNYGVYYYNMGHR